MAVRIGGGGLTWLQGRGCVVRLDVGSVEDIQESTDVD